MSNHYGLTCALIKEQISKIPGESFSILPHKEDTAIVYAHLGCKWDPLGKGHDPHVLLAQIEGDSLIVHSPVGPLETFQQLRFEIGNPNFQNLLYNELLRALRITKERHTILCH